MRKFISWGILIFELMLIYSLIRGIQSSLASRQRVDVLEEKKQELLMDRAELTQRLEFVESDEYLEQVAREELNLAKPGETVVIVPEGFVDKQLTVQEKVPDKREIWQKWLEVLWASGE